MFQSQSVNSALQAKSDSALPGAIWAQFRPKMLNKKAIPAHVISALGPNQP